MKEALARQFSREIERAEAEENESCVDCSSAPLSAQPLSQHFLPLFPFCICSLFCACFLHLRPKAATRRNLAPTFWHFENIRGMGNAGSAGGGQEQQRVFVKRDESFGSKSPRRCAKMAVNRASPERNGTAAASIGGGGLGLRQYRNNRSHSLEQSGTHSPSSSRSSSSNSYINSILAGTASDRSCLRQSTEPMFQISGDLNPHQITLVKRGWKMALKAVNNDETEIASRLLLRIFQLDPRNLAYFSLKEGLLNELRQSTVFISHIKAFEPTLVHVMTHLTNATTLSKHLQQLGGRHVNYTGVTYKCSYWKSFTQALADVLSEQGNAELHEALIVLGDFCVEQMRIGYRIEYKLQCEAERLAQAKHQQRRQRICDQMRGHHFSST